MASVYEFIRLIYLEPFFLVFISVISVFRFQNVHKLDKGNYCTNTSKDLKMHTDYRIVNLPW